MSQLRIKDTDWVRQAFMLPKASITAQDYRRRLFSHASMKFTDTTLGGNFAINPPPQFTRHADLKVKSRFSKSAGMGRYYSEAIDDNSVLVHMRFGVPAFNSLTTFFTGFYNTEASLLARTGRAPGLFYTVGKAAGFVVTLPLLPIIATGNMVRFLANKPASKFYYLKPAMVQYWSAVNTIANDIAVNMGIVPKVFSDAEKELYEQGNDYGPDDIARYHDMMPTIYKKGGGIDVYALSSKAQRLANRNRELLSQIMESDLDRAALQKRLQKFSNEGVSDSPTIFPGSDNNTEPGFEAYLAAWTKTSASQPATGEGADYEKHGSWWEGFADFALAEFRDGGQFVTFRVDNPGTINESFSNSTGESEIASSIKSMSSSAKNTRFNFAGGNIGDDFVSSTLESALGAVKDLATGIADGVGMSGLAALAGSAFVDIPQQWQDSVASLPSMNFTVELRAPYGNKMSRFMDLMIPLSMLLAGSLPLSTGKQSYTSPFLVELYCKGRCQTRLGIIDSISITRGTGNLGWTKDGEPLGIDVTFSVKDLSSIMHVPISANYGVGDAFVGVLGTAAGAGLTAAGAAIGGTAGAAAGAVAGTAVAGAALGVFDDDNTFTDYMAVLGSLSLADQVYTTKKLRLNLTRQLTKMESLTSPARAAGWFAGTWPGRMISAISLASDVGRP